MSIRTPTSASPAASCATYASGGMEDEDAVGDAVGELRLLGVEVLQGAEGAGLGVIGHQIPLVDVGAAGLRLDGGAAQIQGHLIAAIGERGAAGGPGAHYGPEHLVSGLDVRGDGGLGGVQGLVVVEEGGGDDRGVGVQFKAFN